jgi:hypothetical protein
MTAVRLPSYQPDETRVEHRAQPALDGGDNRVVAEVVRKGAGADLENSAQVMQANDFKAVLDTWAQDLAKSFHLLRSK